MPPTIRRSWHDCWKQGATKSCLGVDYICFAHPSQSFRVGRLGFAICSAPAHGCIVDIGAQSTKSTNLLSFIMCRPQLGQLSWPHNPEPPWSPGKKDQYA